jgi:hypoxanthine phosphoribosyltransferase
MADFCRAITVPCEIGFMCAKSYYSGTVSTGAVKITMDLEQDISNYHVVIVEDIIDTGRTLNDVVNLLKARNPLSLKVVTLLDKPSRRVVKFEPDIALFTIPDHFVIGYGLDCGENYRNLPYIAEYNEKGE